MQRKLPIAEIEGVAFYVDAEQEVLWQMDKPANRISFNAFFPRNNGYAFLYDRRSHSWAWDREEINRHLEEHCWVTLPALMELDPEGMALRYDIPLEDLCPDTMPRPPEKVVALISPVTHLK